MHSFENVTSVERKRANWVVLEKLFKVGLAEATPAHQLLLSVPHDTLLAAASPASKLT